MLQSMPQQLPELCPSPGGGVLFLRGRRQSQSWVIVILLLRNLAVGVDREAVQRSMQGGLVIPTSDRVAMTVRSSLK